MLPWEWALVHLRESRNYWVTTARRDGAPHAMPVWGVMLDETVYFGTSPTSRKGRNLARDPRVVVHTESGDECVILEGIVEAVEVDDRVADAFETKYDWRPKGDDDSAWYRVRPRIAYAWTEKDYPRTATRFAFD
jgi:general stress protein 26